MSANGDEIDSSKNGIFISLAMAGTIAGVSILFALVASRGEAFNGITQLLTPQSQNSLQVQEEIKDGSSTNAAEANQQQEPPVTSVEVKPELPQPSPDQESGDTPQNIINEQSLPSINALGSDEQNIDEKPVNNPAGTLSQRTDSNAMVPSPQESSIPDKSPETKSNEDIDNPDHNLPPLNPSSSQESTDESPGPSPKQTKEEEKEKDKEQQQKPLNDEKQEEKLQKQIEELQKKMQVVLDSSANSIDDAEKQLSELYAKAPDALQYLFGGFLQSLNSSNNE